MQCWNILVMATRAEQGTCALELLTASPFMSCSNEIHGLILNALVTYGSKIVLRYLEQVL